MSTTIPKGYKTSPLGLIPHDWDIMHFEQVADIDSLTLKSDTNKKYKFDYISLSDVDSEEFKIETTPQVFETAPSRARKIVRKGDILMSTVRPNLQGFTIIKDEVKDLIASTGFSVITCTHCNNEFLFHCLFSSGISKQLYQLIVGSNYPAINSSDVRKLKLPIPSSEEQEVIALVLTLIDTNINKINQLVAKKETQKKALMQQLLTGKKRLKGFDGEWKLTKFKDSFQFIKSYSISRDGLTTDEFHDGVYCVHYGDIHAFYENELLDFSTQKRIPKIADKHIEVKKGDYLRNGDIVFADASEDYEGVGETVEVVNIGNEIAVGGLHTIVLRGINDTTANGFRSYLFASETVRNTLRKKATGTSVYSITKTTLETLSFKLPALPEQTAIARILQTADKEIQLLKAKAEKLKQQKKGMMQVLLIGKKRLKVK